MRTGFLMTSLFAVLLMMFAAGCEQEKKTTGTTGGKTGEKGHDDHDGHDDHKNEKGDDHAEEYHPGHSQYGLVYHTDGLEPAVGVKLIEDKGIVTITNQPKDNTEEYKDTPIAVSEVTITPPAGGKKDVSFTLPAKNKGDDGNASVFELEDPALAVVMTGNYTVSFELDGKKHEYEVFSHSH